MRPWWLPPRSPSLLRRWSRRGRSPSLRLRPPCWTPLACPPPRLPPPLACPPPRLPAPLLIAPPLAAPPLAVVLAVADSVGTGGSGGPLPARGRPPRLPPPACCPPRCSPPCFPPPLSWPALSPRSWRLPSLSGQLGPTGRLPLAGVPPSCAPPARCPPDSRLPARRSSAHCHTPLAAPLAATPPGSPPFPWRLGAILSAAPSPTASLLLFLPSQPS